MRARSRSTVRTRPPLAALERLGRTARALGPTWHALYDREIARLRADSPDAAIDLALRLAQIFEVQLGDVARRDHALPASCSRSTRAPAGARSARPSVRGDRAAGRELAEVLERKVEVASSPDEILAHPVPARSAATASPGRRRARRRAATARSWPPRPSTTRRCARSKGCSRRACCRGRSARSSSRCIGCRKPGTA